LLKAVYGHPPLLLTFKNRTKASQCIGLSDFLPRFVSIRGLGSPTSNGFVLECCASSQVWFRLSVPAGGYGSARTQPKRRSAHRSRSRNVHCVEAASLLLFLTDSRKRKLSPLNRQIRRRWDRRTSSAIGYITRILENIPIKFALLAFLCVRHRLMPSSVAQSRLKPGKRSTDRSS